jgi:hypothetical protein
MLLHVLLFSVKATSEIGQGVLIFSEQAENLPEN